jgi:YVTN family beta-propeller protein
VTATTAIAKPSEPTAKAHRCGKLYVPNGRGDSLAVIDPARRKLLRTVPIGVNPAMAFATPNGKKVFILDTYVDPPNRIDVVDTATDTVKALTIVGMPFGASISSDSKRFYVALTGGARVEVYDVQTTALLSTFPLGDDPLSLVLSSDDKVLYVAFATGRVGAYDAKTGAEIHAPIATGGVPAWVSLSPDGSHLYSLNGTDDNITVVDTREFAVVGEPIDTRGAPVTSWNSPDGKYLYSAGGLGSSGRGVVAVIDAKTFKVVKWIDIPGPAQSVSFSDDGRYGFVPNWGPGAEDLGSVTLKAFLHIPYTGPDGQVAVFDTATNTLVKGKKGTIAVGKIPGTAICQFGNGEPGR